MNQVHKENLTQVENALPNRQGLEVEIFGMEGIPQDMLDQHRNRILQNFQQAQKDRQIATGNPLPGQGHQQKKIKTETPEELKKRMAEFRQRKKEIAANGGVDPNAPPPAPPAAEPQAVFVSFTVLGYGRFANRYRTRLQHTLPKTPTSNQPSKPPPPYHRTPTQPATSPHAHHPAQQHQQVFLNVPVHLTTLTT